MGQSVRYLLGTKERIRHSAIEMNSFFNRTDLFPISLGFNCHVKVFIEILGERDHIPYLRQPFDWLGTPMWSICELIQNDFKDLTNRECIVNRRRFVEKDTEFPTNTLYNTVFVHDYGKDIDCISDDKWNQVHQDYLRRIKRWNDTLICGKTMLFIRLEEDCVERVEYPGTKKGPEYTYVESFAKLMKQKGIPFILLYLTTTHETNWDPDLNICSIQFKKDHPSTIVSAMAIEKILNANKSFIMRTMWSKHSI